MSRYVNSAQRRDGWQPVGIAWRTSKAGQAMVKVVWKWRP